MECVNGCTHTYTHTHTHTHTHTLTVSPSRVQQQLQAYVDWVNSQLRKRPGSRAVRDLRTDMRDGVALAHLIHVVGESIFPVSLSHVLWVSRQWPCPAISADPAFVSKDVIASPHMQFKSKDRARILVQISILDKPPGLRQAKIWLGPCTNVRLCPNRPGSLSFLSFVCAHLHRKSAAPCRAVCSEGAARGRARGADGRDADARERGERAALHGDAPHPHAPDQRTG